MYVYVGSQHGAMWGESSLQAAVSVLPDALSVTCQLLVSDISSDCLADAMHIQQSQQPQQLLQAPIVSSGRCRLLPLLVLELVGLRSFSQPDQTYPWHLHQEQGKGTQTRIF